MALLSTDGASDAAMPAAQIPSPGLGVRPVAQRSGRRVQIAAAAVAAVLGVVALLCSARGRPEVSSSAAVNQPAAPAWESDVIEAFTPKESAGHPADICTHFTKLKLEKCLHNNLARHGPDEGDEGIIYHAKDVHTGHEVELLVNAVSAYNPFSPRWNGMSGEFGRVNIRSGSNVSVMFHVRDPVTKEPVTEEHFALTFFDLDQGSSKTSQESVTVDRFETFALSDDVNPGEVSEVSVATSPDGSRTFKSSTFGTGEDNPKHPDRLNKKQRSRAVGVRFKDFHSVKVTFAATGGVEPRVFTFVAYPALLCEDYLPLDNLKVASSETLVVADRSDVFQKWFVHEGDWVMPGSEMFAVKSEDGSVHIYHAPVKGKVVKTQPLKWGDLIRQRVSDKTIAVIATDPILPPLRSETGDAQTVVPAGMIFKKYHVEENDVVLKGDPIADVADARGQVTTLTAARAGPITARQALTPGDSTDRVQGGNICTVGRFDKLPVSGLSHHADAPPDSTFVRYLTDVGDHVDMNEPVAEVKVNGNVQKVQAPAAGTVTARAEELLKGMPIDEAMKDHAIIVIGESGGAARKRPPPGNAMPWWLGLLLVLAVMSCCLFVLFGAMRKPEEPYRPSSPRSPRSPRGEPEQPEDAEEAEEPLIKAETEPAGLRLDWQEGGRVITTYATRRPLGIKHNFEAPIVVSDFTINSYAKLELGVRAGWKLRRIGAEELDDSTNFDEVNEQLWRHMRSFLLWPLPLSFKRPGSSEAITIEFWRRPIGIEFTNRAPIKVSKIYPFSPAAAARIEQGWYITQIGEADVTQSTNFKEVIGYFGEGVEMLDEVGTSTVTSR